MASRERLRLLNGLLADAAIDDSALADALAYRDCLASRAREFGFGEEDVRKLGESGYVQEGLPAGLATRLNDAIDDTLKSIVAFLGPSKVEATSGTDLDTEVIQLLRTQRDNLAKMQDEITTRHEHIHGLLSQISEIHAILHSNLLTATQEIPPQLNKKREAQHDLLATSIEASLIKLSLIRARYHHLLYGSDASSATPSMENALKVRNERMQDEETKLEKEERELDRRLGEYDGLLRLVDGGPGKGRGGGGGFRQVLADWKQVQRETEECKRDLRRMGWTGD